VKVCVLHQIKKPTISVLGKARAAVAQELGGEAK